MREVAPGLWVREKVLGYGWGLNMTLVALPGGGLLVYSPTWDGPGTFEAVEALGEPRLLVAPSHWHHLSLQRFRDRWPRAVAAASRAALPRLVGKGHRGLVELESTAAMLPPGARWLFGEGLKNGEAWLALPEGPTWIVCDAFFNVERPVTGLTGVFLRWARVTPGLSIGQTFHWVGIRRLGVYREWLLAALARERPTRLLVAHGEPAVGEGLADRLVELASWRLR
jgi:hypothetical protein